MLEAILSALVELITGEKPKAPPPRRNRQQPGGGGGPTTPGQPVREEPQPRPLTLEDVFKRMMGSEDEEEAPPPAPVPERRPPPRPQQHTPQPAAPARVITSLTEAVEAAKMAEARVEAKMEAATQGHIAISDSRERNMPEFVAALRGNADAARQAFVLAEIFGKPVADREQL